TVAACLLRRIAIQVLHQQWAGTDQTHIAATHIPKLRQFVETGTAQKSPQTSDALPIGEELTLSVPLVGHGSELERDERHASVARAFLPKKNWASHTQPN